MCGLVYRLHNKLNGKNYIGVTRLLLSERWQLHLRAARGGSKQAVHRALRKYGKSSFSLHRLESVRDTEQLETREAFFIKKFSSFGALGYNQNAGGGGRAKLELSADDKLNLRRLYVTDKLSTREIGRRLGLCNTSICVRLRRAGIAIRQRSWNLPDRSSGADLSAKNLSMLRKAGLTKRAIARKLRVTDRSVRRALKKFKLH